MSKRDFWTTILNHFEVYVNLRHAGHRHSVYVRDNVLPDEVGDELSKIFIRILRGEAFSEIKREITSRCRESRRKSKTSKSR
ncbi:MAG: hypothetical protein UW46_C0001G0090 [Candidatus Yanofskybacteria bacterium GW2011_GWF1_44_227]|uniref:Uncharacterized protein n=1 Tax=Candidatus Yanofskybacteria bacterium GW2011_GWE2_40_11 TaxID=1619033 RepID=A0A0G0QUU2_9BACT|nr:MAG: hypothetical protein UT69_C0013G0020 [Candidatus Yanofskybacteria bacterium GW2011_GWE1_40_10]KKR41116.1 MAG: hypothetical protein UT75_C0001G0020 [Candidatus Yanofskybacteria bacterium GW2011_GWE2_40_11]KKT53600.1 MAG: hypothetical protein UW46_C0001G0090 [Candidatus Yanofskybacteria bacterium GW2011_GWF1_44_227]OGN36273.1 MAG: hypothetical protein A2241_00835 [Candidatus Yanofskybacteria bacterium RIFOXYA2_FULL_45_28]OGN36989.1 MAG: hypothetical protein A2207_01485 [Candidatus Yanofsk